MVVTEKLVAKLYGSAGLGEWQFDSREWHGQLNEMDWAMRKQREKCPLLKREDQARDDAERHYRDIEMLTEAFRGMARAYNAMHPTAPIPEPEGQCFC